jgi:ribose transport system substrate-binding protein
MRWRAFGISVLAASMAVTALSGSAAAATKMSIGYAVMGFDHPLFQAMMAGARAEAASLGVDLQLVDGGFDPNKQNAQIEDFTAKHVDALLVNPVTAKEEVPVLQKAAAAGIPVVAIDTRPVGFDPTAYVAMNHFQGGYIIGYKIAGDLSCKGSYAVIWAVGNDQAAERIRGLKTGLQEYCQVHGLQNQFQEVGSFSGITGPLRETAVNITNQLLTKYPAGQLSFIFGQTDEWGNGAYLATKAANRQDVKVYAMDDNNDMRKFIAEKQNLIATTAHMPFEIGKAAVLTLYNVKNNKPYLKEIRLNFQLVTQENVANDPGFAGAHTASFDSALFAQQLPLGGTTSGTTSGAAPAAAQSSNGLTSVLIVLVIVLAAALGGTFLWAQGRRRVTLD